MRRALRRLARRWRRPRISHWRGELLDPDDVASIDEWGHMG